MEHNAALIEILDDVFGSATIDEWRERLRTFTGVWDVNQTPEEVVDDPQALANVFVARGEEPGPPLTVVHHRLSSTTRR